MIHPKSRCGFRTGEAGMCYAWHAESLYVVCWAYPANPTPQTPRTPALLHPQNRPQTTARGPNGQSGAAIATSARAHCCTDVQGTPASHPTGPAPTAVLHGRRNCPRCPFARWPKTRMATLAGLNHTLCRSGPVFLVGRCFQIRSDSGLALSHDTDG